MAGDRLSPGDLVPYHEYRKKLKHLYLCKKCARSFDSADVKEECIFCGGEIKELERDDILTGKPMYTYTCATCYKRFVAEKADVCIKCGSKFLHSHKTTRISTRELLSTRKTQIKNKLKKRLLKKIARSGN